MLPLTTIFYDEGRKGTDWLTVEGGGQAKEQQLPFILGLAQRVNQLRARTQIN